MVAFEKEISKVYQYYLIVFKKNNYSTCACWIGDDYSQLGAMRFVGYLSSQIQRALVE